MAIYKLGSKGKEVEQIQVELKAYGFYLGPIDGDFGGGTYSAVRQFQLKKNLVVDGLVGPATWKALIEETIPEPAILNKPLDYRCLVLAGLFETGKGDPQCFCGLSGDFDDQGMSLGVLQWNIGQRTLQPLLGRMISNHENETKAIFGDYYEILKEALSSSYEMQLSFFKSVQNNTTHRIVEPWKGMFKTLGRSEVFQAIQLQAAHWRFERARAWAEEYELWSERAVALMFDINIQNGSIPKTVQLQIKNDISQLEDSLPKEKLEIEKMTIIANRRAEAVNPKWVNDVRTRKLCIANGKGRVHGLDYDLEHQLGIRLKAVRN